MITHPEKILFPDVGITKGELASYYKAIAPVMLPHLRRRPITMERFHRGIGAPVSAPCTWEELEQGVVGPKTFTLRTMVQRVADVGDLWADMLKKKRSLKTAIRRLETKSA